MSAKARVNSFDIVRFLAALLVIFSHSFAFVGLAQPHAGGVHIGGFSVWVFFILSGYLITYSWKQYPRFTVFMTKRILRIIPGLAVAVLLTVVILGFFSTIPYRKYIGEPFTISYFNNILMYNTQYSLPGVFTDNILPNEVNDSIWTLAYEFTMYGAVAVLGVFSLMKRRRVEIVWGVAFSSQCASDLMAKFESV